MRLILPEFKNTKIVTATTILNLDHYYILITSTGGWWLLVGEPGEFKWAHLEDTNCAKLVDNFGNALQAVMNALANGGEVHEFATRKEMAEFILKHSE